MAKRPGVARRLFFSVRSKIFYPTTNARVLKIRMVVGFFNSIDLFASFC